MEREKKDKNITEKLKRSRDITLTAQKIRRAKDREIKRLRKKLDESYQDMLVLSESYGVIGHRFEALVKVSEILPASGDLDQLLHGILNIVEIVMKVQASSLFLIDQSGKKLAVQAATGEKAEEIKKLSFEVGKGIVGLVAESGKPMIANDAAKDNRQLKKVDEILDYKTLNILCVPLTFSGKVNGALEILNRSDGEPFSDSDTLLLTTIANQAAVLIEHARLLNKFEAKIDELTTLMDVSKAVNSTLNLYPLLDLIMKLSTKVMGAEASALMLVDKKTNELVFTIAEGEAGEKVKEIRVPMGAGIAGWVAEKGEPLLVPDVSKDPRHFKEADKRTSFVTKSILCVPLIRKEEVLGVVQVLNKPSYSDDDVRLFTALADQSAIAIENALLHQEQLQAKVIEEEMKKSHDIQTRLLPQKSPEVEGIRIGNIWVAAREVGGDYYDFIQFDEHRLGIVVADVTGKGMSAALVMTMARAVLRSQVGQLASDSSSGALGRVVTGINHTISADMNEDVFITMFFGLFDARTQKLSYVDCGHNKPILFHRGSGEHESLKGKGIALGIFPDFEYIESEVDLSPGDLVFIYTDGVPEAMNLDHELFGMERVLEILQDNTTLDSQELAQLIYHRLGQFAGEAPQHDDITLLVADIL